MNAAVPPGDPESNSHGHPEASSAGEEAMTGAQASYLKQLSEEADEDDAYDPGLTRAEASRRIDALQKVTGRGR